MARDPFFAHRTTAHVLDALLATKGNLAERPLRAHGKGHGPGPHFAAMRLQRLNLFPSLAPEVQGGAHGYKGKGVTTHLILDAHGHPLGALFTAAHIDELKERLQLLKALGIWKKEGMILETDRVCTSKSPQEQLFRRGIYPAIFQKGGHQIKRAPEVSIRWKIEKAFSNLKRFGHR